jgi:protein-tyrosine phosphatase
MTSILMVCLGNICRSPLAHGILESKLPNDLFYIDSAGTANYHIGDLPDHRSIKIAKSHGIDISNQRGRQFIISDFDTFDFIYVMDQSNYNSLLKLARNSTDINKIKLILEETTDNRNINVPDPYYGDIDDFEHVYQLLNSACEHISKKLINK